MKYRFGTFELDVALQEFRSEGTLRPLEPQVFSLLAHLIEHRGRVVGKEELVQTVWEGRIVSDAAIDSRISAARQAVGDNGKAQAIIRTLPRRGVRFTADVSVASAGNSNSETIDDNANLTMEDAAPVAVTIRRRLPLPPKPTLAVLPFANISDTPNLAYLADGITNDLITALSKNRWLLVLARGSTVAFRDPVMPLRELAVEVDADYIVTGGVRRDGNRLRVNVQLIQGRSGAHLWAEKFDRELSRVFDLQDEIAATIAARVGLELQIAEQQRAKRQQPKNLDAWDNYLLGLAQFHTFSGEGHAAAQAHFAQAIELDPHFALAHAMRAFSIILSTVYFDVEPDEPLLEKVLDYSKTAVSLDGQDAVTRGVLGRAHLIRGEYDHALNELEASIDLNPCLPVTHCQLADALTCSGLLDVGLRHFDVALQLGKHDPWRWGMYSYKAMAHLFHGEFDEAALWAERATRFPNAHFWANANMAAALGHLNRPEEARGVVEGLLKRKPDFSCEYPRRHLAHVRSTAQMDAIISGLKKAGIPETVSPGSAPARVLG